MGRIRFKTHASLVIGRPKRELRRLLLLLLLMTRMKLCVMMGAKRRMVTRAEWGDR